MDRDNRAPVPQKLPRVAATSDEHRHLVAFADTAKERTRGIEREPRGSLRNSAPAALLTSPGRAMPLGLNQDEDVNAIRTVRTKHDGLFDVAGA